TVLLCASVLSAQQPAQPAQANDQINASVIPAAEVSAANSTAAATPEPNSTASGPTTGEPSVADPAGAPAPQSGTAPAGAAPASSGNDDQWHFSVSPYLWFPGVHGSANALGHGVDFKAS